MTIEHIAMYVNDPENARDFFVNFLDGKAGDLYYNEKTGFKSYFVSFDNGARLEIMSKPGMTDPVKDPNRTGFAHIAFCVGDVSRVNELTRKINDAGYRIQSIPRTTGDGYYESCVVAIEDNLVELTASGPAKLSEEDKEVDLDKFHRNRFIMFALFAVSVVVSLIGMAYIVTAPAVVGIGVAGLLAAVLFGFISGAMFCPYCGEPISRNGFGSYCKYCGKKIL